MEFISYLRISDSRKQDSGLGIEGQRAAVDAFITSTNGGSRLLQEFVETESAAKPTIANRPVLRQAMAAAKRAKATLIVAKLDRLARSESVISVLLDDGIVFKALDLPEADTATPTGRLFVQMMSTLAAFESRRIGERTRAALKAKRARGETLGNPASLEKARAAARVVLIKKGKDNRRAAREAARRRHR